MEPVNLRFGGGADGLLHPLVAIELFLALILILFLPRKYIIFPLFLTIFLTPKAQNLMLAGAHLTVGRILILTVLARKVMSKRSLPRTPGEKSMDRLVACWALAYLTVFSLQWMNSQAFIKSVGDPLDAMGGYFAVRFCIQDREDVTRAIKAMALIAIGSALVMVNEQITGANLFARLGGVAAETVRDGKVRSQAAFAVFITAGSYGATLLPLLIWVWSTGKFRIGSLLGMAAATVMVITCHASTTLAAYAAGIFALCLWPLRERMRILRWGIVITLVSLHMVMHGPVWSLLEKIDLTGSSSSYHRYMLIDNCIRHFSEWWFIGCTNYDTWGYDMWDLSDQYVAYAETGGLITLVLFLAIISRSFGAAGTSRKIVRGNHKEEWFFWCLGAALFAHVVTYFGIGYFDQMQLAWFALIAIICVGAASAARPASSSISDGKADALEPALGWTEMPRFS